MKGTNAASVQPRHIAHQVRSVTMTNDENTEAGVIAAGSTVVVRDAEWVVEQSAPADGGLRLTCRGVGELVRDSTATFFTSLDDVQVLDPTQARLVLDETPGYRRTRLWVEAVLRKTPVPLHEEALSVAHRMLLDPLDYQREVVARALSLENLRPRLLIADAVGLGKTLEIGMVIAELARRGRAERILVVTPRHVLEQMQRELWTRFAIPLVRLDSDGIAKVRQELPASRNPFTYYPRVIVSVDTLKSDRYRAHLEQQHWDVVVIDESHNVTNTGTLNHQLASVLAPRTQALLLASATPHNGDPRSFAALVDLLDPTAIVDRDDYRLADISRLFVRRHRHSPDVAREVGHDWAERAEPEVVPVEASDAEEAAIDELWSTWLHPDGGSSPASGKGAQLFGWTLAKAFLSSPHALAETVRNRRSRLAGSSHGRSVSGLPQQARREDDALARLGELADKAIAAGPAKLEAIARRLAAIGVGSGSDTRVVLFTERLATLRWLREALPLCLGLGDSAFEVLHGGLPDHEQMRVVEQFGLAGSPVRVLLTGDVASEGVNLHRQCHHLLHLDVPWSLIRIEQRNGRIDRYGQRQTPRIAALALTSRHDGFSGDVRVLTRLLAKEDAAHRALGDAGSLMRLHDEDREEEAVARALAAGRDLDDVVPDPSALLHADGDAGDLDWSFEELFATVGEAGGDTWPVREPPGLFATDLEYLREALAESFDDSSADPRRGGIGWREHDDRRLVELVPPPDLVRRLRFLPQGYLADRGVRERLVLATSRTSGEESMAQARRHGSSSQWPQAHYLSPLHPVLEWATDRAMARLGRQEVPAAVADVPAPTVIVQGVLHNLAGQVVLHAVRAVVLLGRATGAVDREDWQEVLREAGVGVGSVNPAAPVDLAAYDWVVGRAVAAMRQQLAVLRAEREAQLAEPIERAARRIQGWREAGEQLAHDLVPAQRTRQQRLVVRRAQEAERLVASMQARPEALVRPLVVLLPGGPA
jgi:superfamily II DNA or RNA helicase